MADRPIAALVGRGECLDSLSEGLRGAAAGRPRIVVVSGETGVGKTRLVGEFLKRERPRALVGACVPVAGEALPFAPLAQGLRRLAGSAGHEVQAFPELVRLLSPVTGPGSESRTGSGLAADPGVAASVTSAEAAGGSAWPAPTIGSPEGSTDPQPRSFHQLGFFQSVLGLLGALGRDRPVIQVVEDIHWADRSTLDLLRFLATNLVDEHALLVLTYRNDQVTRASAVRTWLAELGRLPRVDHLRLSRLDEPQTLRLVEALAGPDLDPRLARTIVARCDGNPLFAQHLVWHAGTGGDGLPIALRDLLAVRLAGLPEATQTVVSAACVLARRASLALLAATSGLPIETVEDAVVPALERHVLTLTADDRIAFHHPAFREVAYQSLLPTRRSRLHRAAAQALEGGPGPGAATGGAPRGGTARRAPPDQAPPESGRASAGEIARHWHLAGDLHRALDSALTAAFEAERIYAFADAHTYFVRVLDLMTRVERTIDGPVGGSVGEVDVQVDRLEILRHAARSARVIGDVDEAVRLLDVALRADLAPRVRAAVLEDLGYIESMRGNGPAAQAALESARDLLPTGERSVLAAKVAAGLAAHAAAYSRFEDADREARIALELALAVGARPQEGRIRNAIGVVAAARGRHAEAIGELRAALLIGRETTSPDAVCDAYINLSHVLGEAGRHREVVQLAAEGVEELARLGVLRQSGTIMLANAAESAFRLGRFDDAEAFVQRSLSYDAGGILAAPTLCRAAQVCVVRGEFDAALRHCARAREIVQVERSPTSWCREVAEASAEVELWAGHPQVAYALVVEALESLAGTDEAQRSSWLYCLGLRALGDLADARRSEGSRRAQERMREVLAGLAPGRPAAPRAGDPPAMAAWIATAAAEAARAQARAEPTLWADAERAWAAQDRPLETAYSRWREAESRLVGGVSGAAIDALRRADAMARGYGIVPLVQEVDRLARWHRLEAALELAAPVVVQGGGGVGGGAADGVGAGTQAGTRADRQGASGADGHLVADLSALPEPAHGMIRLDGSAALDGAQVSRDPDGRGGLAGRNGLDGSAGPQGSGASGAGGAAGHGTGTGAGAAGDPNAEYGLTARELEVLRALAAGRTNHEIGEALGISAKTASVHVSNILRKLAVPGRAEAARVGHRLGLDAVGLS